MDDQNETRQNDKSLQSEGNKVSSHVSTESDVIKSKKKINFLALAFGITTIICGGLAVYFGIDYFKPKGEEAGEDKNVVNTVVEQDDKVVVENDLNVGNEYEKVRKTMDELVAGIENNWSGIIATDGLTYKPEGLNTYIPMRFNFEIKINNTKSDEDNIAVLQSNLEKAGFNYLGILPFLGSAGPQIHGYLNSDNIVCAFFGDTEWREPYAGQRYIQLDCADTDWFWLTDEERSLISELETAYHDKTGEYPRTLVIGAKIQDSQNVPYQTLRVGLGGGVGLFYRVSSEANWQYFAATQSPLECDKYNTEDLKKAFAGDTCHNDSTESTVQP